MESERMSRASGIESDDVIVLGEKSAVVRSQSGDDRYNVDFAGEPSCECPDHIYREVTCKHLAAAADALGILTLPNDD